MAEREAGHEPGPADAAGRLSTSVARAKGELAERRGDLSQAKRELLARRLSGRLGAGTRQELADRAAARREEAAPTAGFAQLAGEPPLDLAAEAALDPAIRVEHPPGAGSMVDAPAGGLGAGRAAAAVAAGGGLDSGAAAGGEPAAVLLTGATGFLGAFLLAELLRQTRATVVCLVRAGGVEEGTARLQRHLEAHGAWDESSAGRIRVLPGDLARPLLGLPREEFDAAGDAVDAIVHNGAAVLASHPYAALKAVNVLGTQEVIRLACRGRPKPLHFVSTLDVFFASGAAGGAALLEDDPLDHPGGEATGYAQSKWVAEKLVAVARERGLPVWVYRFGRVSWHSASGVWNPDDGFRRVVDACLELGSVPDLDAEFVLTPVEFIARAIVALARGAASGGGAGRSLHLVNPQPVTSGQLAAWARARGRPLAVAPDDEWLAAARRLLPESMLPNLARLRARASSGAAGGEGGGAGAGGGGRRGEPDSRIARAALAARGIECPPIDEASLGAYLERYARRPT